MLKAAGAITIICISVWYGLSGYIKQKTRLRAINDMISALIIIKGEISIKQTPVPEMLRFLAGATEGSVRQIFENCRSRLSLIGRKTFFEIWSESVSDDGTIGAEEREAIIDLGRVLGRYDTETQTASIDRVYSELERIREKVNEKMHKTGKAQAAVCAAAGLIIVIILI